MTQELHRRGSTVMRANDLAGACAMVLLIASWRVSWSEPFTASMKSADWRVALRVPVAGSKFNRRHPKGTQRGLNGTE
jgi:hypothetical protein